MRGQGLGGNKYDIDAHSLIAGRLPGSGLAHQRGAYAPVGSDEAERVFCTSHSLFSPAVRLGNDLAFPSRYVCPLLGDLEDLAH